MRLSRALVLTIAVVLIPIGALADAGVPMIMLMYPALIVALVPVILIEAEVFRRRVNLPYKKVLGAVGVANGVSTLVGYPISWVLLLIIGIVTTRGYAYGLRGMWSKFVASVLQAAWLIPYETQMYWMIPIASFVGLIPAFFVSVYSEEYVVRRILGRPKSELMPITWTANLWSYAFLAALCAIYGANAYSHKGRPPEIIGFSPKAVELKSVKPFFYTHDDKELLYAATGRIGAIDKVVWRGRVNQGALVSPDSRKILLVSDDVLYVVTADGTSDKVAAVRSVWEHEKRENGQEFWRYGDFQWAADSASMYLVKDVWSGNSDQFWGSDRATLYRYRVADRGFEKVMDHFHASEFYPSDDGLQIFYSKPIGGGDVGLFVRNLNTMDERIVLSTKGKAATAASNLAQRAFFTLSPDEPRREDFFRDLTINLWSTGTACGFSIEDHGRNKCLLSVARGTEGFAYQEPIGETISVPDGRYAVLHVLTGSYEGSLVLDLATGEYGKFPEDVRLYFSVTSADVAGRFALTPRGIEPLHTVRRAKG